MISSAWWTPAQPKPNVASRRLRNAFRQRFINILTRLRPRCAATSTSRRRDKARNQAERREGRTARRGTPPGSGRYPLRNTDRVRRYAGHDQVFACGAGPPGTLARRQSPRARRGFFRPAGARRETRRLHALTSPAPCHAGKAAGTPPRRPYRTTVYPSVVRSGMRSR